MEIKASKKAIKGTNKKIIKIGYCKLQTLLNFESPFAYSTSNMHGWQCDYYEFDNCIISTGYNSIGQNADYNLICEYEKKAQNIMYNINGGNDIKRPLIKELLNKFLMEV